MLPSPHATRDDCRRVAGELGCSVNLVSMYASLFGRLRPVPRLLPPPDEVISMIAAGVRPRHIAIAAGVTAPAVYRMLDRHGYALRGGVVTPKLQAA